MSKIKKKCARSIMDYIYVLWTDKIHCFITPTNQIIRLSNLCLLKPCKYTYFYGCSKESVQVFKQKLLAVIFLLRKISYGLVILSRDFDRC